MKTYFIILTAFLLLSSCVNPVKPEELYGEWKYVKVENPNQNPAYVMPQAEVSAANPSIIFTTRSELIIMWGGKRLSHGTFRMKENRIRYKEVLPGGTTREFPFLIKEISSDKLVFETMEQESSRITAVKIK